MTKNCIQSVSAPFAKAYRDRENQLRQLWKDEQLLLWFLGPLAVLSFPVAAFHNAWCQSLRRPSETQDRANVIDAWHGSSLALWLVILFFVAPQIASSSYRWLLLLPLLRVADVLYTMLVLVKGLKVPREPARALLLTVIHYSEFLIIFACAFWAVFSIDPGGCIKKEGGGDLFALDFLYYSAVTATSVGYSSILPVSSPECAVTRGLSMAEPMVFLLVTALLLPRAIAKILNIQAR